MMMIGLILYSSEEVVDGMMSKIGSIPIMYDQGYWSLGVRFLFKLIDEHLFASLVTCALPLSNEFKRLSSIRMANQSSTHNKL